MKPEFLILLETPEARRVLALFAINWGESEPRTDADQKLLSHMIAAGIVDGFGNLDPLARKYLEAAAWSAIGLDVTVDDEPEVEGLPYALFVNGRQYAGTVPSNMDLTRTSAEIATDLMRLHKLEPRPGLRIGISLADMARESIRF